MTKNIILLALAALAGTVQTPHALAQTADSQRATQTFAFDIPSGKLSKALNAWAEICGYQFAWSDPQGAAVESPGVSGRMSAEAALTALVSGTDLTFAMSDRTATILRRDSKQRMLGPVRVEGATDDSFGRRGQAAGVNGINGSRDITATEGTGSYTSGALTIGSKSPQALKDVPQSVSVITAERMADQNMRDFNDVMRYTPGVTTVQTNSLISEFYSRGYKLTTIQIDGSAPLVTQDKDVANTTGYFPLIDMSMYDHVEILRGAAGLFNGYGDPSGTVNLVRKRPLEHGQVAIEGTVGSWKNYRASVDVSAPLALDNKLRGRAVMTYQDNEYFYDDASDNKTLFYGILEYAITPSLNLSAGTSYTRQDSVPWWGGLPRYENGDDLHLPRNTSFVLPFNRWDFDTTELFTKLEYDLTRNWSLKVNAAQLEQRSDYKGGFFNGAVNPASLTGPVAKASQYEYGSDQMTADAAVSGSFEIFGQQQQIVIGAQYARENRTDQMLYANIWFRDPLSSTTVSSASVNVFDFNPRDPRFLEPAGAPPETANQGGQTQMGAYMNLSTTMFDRLHVKTGIRYSNYKSRIASTQYCTYITTGCTRIGDVRSSSFSYYDGDDFTWPPNYSLSYDITPTLSAYGSYADVYVSQASKLDRDLKTLAPTTGANIEAGLKWEAVGGRLNASIGVYRMERRNFAILDLGAQVYITDPVTGRSTLYYQANNGTLILGGAVNNGAERQSCCYLADDPTRYELSRGVDLELGGQLLPRWEISASYAWNENKRGGKGYGTSEGWPLETRQPEHIFKLWTDYRFSGPGWLSRLGVSGGVQAMSAAYVRGTACVEFAPPAQDGAPALCLPGRKVQFDYTQDAYAVWELKADYEVNERWTVALNAVNLTDQRYYQTTGTSTGGNMYGVPRNYTLSLRGKF
ncbi:TonB-dependent siderophore receptor [Steroidobacter flavus]|uniref:TonB-dependent siderophore receptor n=1 Tax=Steroidobacter flavus TaxID=1842136 RepID=A0ABV8T4B3_9GAMM